MGVGLGPMLCHLNSNNTPVNISMYHSESECRLCTTSFPSMKEVGSRVAWLTFSCFCAKSYISEGPVRHVGLQLCYPAKKCRRKKTLQVTSLPGPKPWGNPSRAGGDAGREQTKEKSELSGYPAVPEPNCRDSLSALHIQAVANTWVSVSVIYPGTCLPGYQHTQLQHADMSIKPEAFVFHICVC